MASERKSVYDLSAIERYTMSSNQRRRLPITRESIVHKFDIAGTEGYLIAGLYEDNSPGELFIVIAKEGSTLRGVMDGFAIMLSMSLQHGVPLETIISKLEGTSFEPSGITGNPEIPMTSSILDYIGRWLRLKFLAEEVK